MSLSRSERIRLITELVEISKNQSLAEFDLVLTEFGHNPIDRDPFSDDQSREVIASLRQLNDGDLLELRRHFEENSSSSPEITDDSGAWQTPRLRLFISHLATNQSFAQEVSTELSKLGVEGFVAHTSINPSAEWQSVIEESLCSADALLGLVQPGFSGSSWCQQEVGWALGAKKPAWFIRMGEDPSGFVARRQWPTPDARDAASVAREVFRILTIEQSTSKRFSDRLIGALAASNSFDESGSIARLLALDLSFSESQLEAIANAVSNNDQVNNSRSASVPLAEIFGKFGRTVPTLAPVVGDL